MKKLMAKAGDSQEQKMQIEEQFKRQEAAITIQRAFRRFLLTRFEVQDEATKRLVYQGTEVVWYKDKSDPKITKIPILGPT